MQPAQSGQLPSGIDRRIAEAIAGHVVALLRDELGLQPQPAKEWIDAKEVARRFGFSRPWVYAHAGQLGAVPTGDGPRPRLRFEPRRVAEGLRAVAAGEHAAPADQPVPAGVPIHVPRVRSRQSRSSAKER